MTSRLTISAIVFSLLSTATLVVMANADANAPATIAMRYVQLERVVVTAPRLLAKA